MRDEVETHSNGRFNFGVNVLSPRLGIRYLCPVSSYTAGEKADPDQRSCRRKNLA